MVAPMKFDLKLDMGALLVLGFVVAGAARDVFFGGIFQQYRFFDVVQVSFGLATVLFAGLVAIRAPAQFRLVARLWRETLLANLGTACAWLSYFFALTGPVDEVAISDIACFELPYASP